MPPNRARDRVNKSVTATSTSSSVNVNANANITTTAATTTSTSTTSKSGTSASAAVVHLTATGAAVAVASASAAAAGIVNSGLRFVTKPRTDTAPTKTSPSSSSRSRSPSRTRPHGRSGDAGLSVAGGDGAGPKVRREAQGEAEAGPGPSTRANRTRMLRERSSQRHTSNHGDSQIDEQVALQAHSQSFTGSRTRARAQSGTGTRSRSRVLESPLTLGANSLVPGPAGDPPVDGPPKKSDASIGPETRPGLAPRPAEIDPVAESYDNTLSTASLPPLSRYTITLALPPGYALSEDEARMEYVRGQEILADGRRRVNEVPAEGVLEDVNRRWRKRRKVHLPDNRTAAGQCGDANVHMKGDQRAGVKVRPVGGMLDAKGPMWTTAQLRYPCTCDLEPLSRGYLLSLAPPLPDELLRLHEDERLSHAQVPTVGERLLDWFTDEASRRGERVCEGTALVEELDPDPELDALEDFELGWKTATGALWRKAGCDGIDFGVGDEDMAKGGLVASDEVEGERSSKAGTSRAATEEAEEVIRSRRLLKGKFKAVPDISPDVHRRGNDTVIPSTHPDTTTAPSEVPISWPISGISPSQTPHKAADTARNSGDMAVAAGVLDASPDWVEESKRRKAPWRRLIRSDSSFGAFWDNLPRPHSYPILLHRPLHQSAAESPARPPDYVLFRHYTSPSVSHPFHPNLQRYIRVHPRGRVYWLIPIHGPVVVPTLNDDDVKLLSGRADHHWVNREDSAQKKNTKVPIPSRGYYLDPERAQPEHSTSTSPPLRLHHEADALKVNTSGIVKKQRSAHPAPIIWSPTLLHHFLHSFLLPLRLSAMYSFSITFSSAKPDPFIDLHPAAPLSSHLYVSKFKSKSKSGAKSKSERDVNVTTTEVTNAAAQPLANDSVADHNNGPPGKLDATTVTAQMPGAADKIAPPPPRPPVRVEAGDHLRLYCDAADALSLRTWLNGVEVDRSVISNMGNQAGDAGLKNVRDVAKVMQKTPVQAGKDVTGDGDQEGPKMSREADVNIDNIDTGCRLFERVRLCLIGERGEVLMVA